MVLLTLLTGLMFCGLKKMSYKEQIGDSQAAHTITILTEDWDHDKTDRFKNETGLEQVDGPTLLLLQKQPREVRRRINKIFIDYLMETNTKVEVLLWMKRNIDPSTCKIVLADFNNNNGCFQDWIEDIPTKLKSCFESVKARCGQSRSERSNLTAFLKVIGLVGMSYIDLIKDTAFLFLLSTILQTTVLTHFTHFTSQIWWLLAFSIFLPLLTSALENVQRRPLIVLGRVWVIKGMRESV